MSGLLILNAKILSMSGAEVYEAMAIVKGKVVYMGSSSNAERRFAATVDRVIELDGNIVTPGFIDSHCHLAGTGYLMTYGVDLSDASSIGEVKDRLRKAAETRSEGSWIYGYGLSEARLKEGRLPRRWDLDEALPSNPVVIEHVSGHLLIANTVALSKTGVTGVSPPGGFVEVDDRGRPTGLLYDSAMNLVFRAMPKPTPEEYYVGILKAQDVWIRNGFTGVEDAGVLGLGATVLESYLRAAREGRLRLRIRYAYPVGSSRELKAAIPRIAIRNVGNLHLGYIKVFYDGSGLAKTALISGDWCEDGVSAGEGEKIRTIEAGDFKEIVRTAVSHGLGLSVHAIGDVAVEEVVSAFDTAGCRGCSVVHGFFIGEESARIMAKLGINVKTQTSFIPLLGKKYAENFCYWRVERFIPLKTLLSLGVNVANGTDANVTPPEPRYGVYGAVFRRAFGLKTDVYGRGEAVDFLDAVKTFTVNSAKATGLDPYVGVIRPGMPGDVVAWNIKTLNPTPEEILGMRPLMTIIDGRVEYSSNRGPY